jgi:hypothetical protein
MAVQIYCKFTPLVWLWQFYKNVTKELIPEQLIVRQLQIFSQNPKIGLAGAAGPRGRFFFQRLDSW